MKFEITEDTIKAHAKVLSQAAVTAGLLFLAHWGAVHASELPINPDKTASALGFFWGAFTFVGCCLSGLGAVVTLLTLGEEFGWWGPGRRATGSGPR